MSAVEALAEVLRKHGPWPHEAAEDVVAAIRSMPAEQKKELGVSPETNGEQK